MSGEGALEEAGDTGRDGDRSEEDVGGAHGAARGDGSAAERRLTRLMKEFSRRQRERPDLVVRPWWSSRDAGGGRRAVGFVVEYCPHGVESAEMAVRPDRVRVEGPCGLREAPLELDNGWWIAGEDVGCPELLANHLLSIADRLLGEAA